ncbi:hypothetical protein TSAR_003626 [Trichomalopsis sarcophagae]|uniref:Uncharacterized protein n=1 Tax=Trichomalopsis sarcophagae TaxID=543379 RepID=A0A232EN87_9HYME|nr:hypothetical protein TSAR_003626 [Trichomalopsis sarcophagae]
MQGKMSLMETAQKVPLRLVLTLTLRIPEGDTLLVQKRNKN